MENPKELCSPSRRKGLNKTKRNEILWYQRAVENNTILDNFTLMSCIFFRVHLFHKAKIGHKDLGFIIHTAHVSTDSLILFQSIMGLLKKNKKQKKPTRVN